VPGQLLEIACDESGYEGEKLIGTTTDVFAHASVHLDTESATACMQELRRRIRSPATEYKANHLLREKHRAVLIWLLGPLGPLSGRASVYLIDKAFFVVGKVIDLLTDRVGPTAPGFGVGQNRQAAAMTGALYGESRCGLDPLLWEAFLAASNTLLRAKDPLAVRTSLTSFFNTIDALRLDGSGVSTDEVLRLVERAKRDPATLRARLLDNSAIMSPMDPLIPAIVHAVIRWGDDDNPVSIVHDRQNTLSADRIAQLKDLFSGLVSAVLSHSARGRLAGLTLVDSTVDPRVQVADILAGTARKVTSDELNDRGDAELTALLRPYVDPHSIWGDDRSWALLEPTSSTRTE
jgi:hypothetical protein